MTCRRMPLAPSGRVRGCAIHILATLSRISVLFFCLCHRVAVAKLFESKSKKVARLTAELAKLEAERLSKIVVVFGYEFDKLGFFTSVSISSVLFVALIVQLTRSRRKWKRLALSGPKNNASSSSGAGTTSTPRYTAMLILGAAIFFYFVSFNMGKALGKNKSAQGKGGVDPQRLARLVIVFGKYELDKTTFYILVATSMILLVGLGAQLGIWVRQWRDSRTTTDARVPEKVAIQTGFSAPPDETSLDVVVVGCGPKSVGWFHLMQFLDMPSINVRAVVEPYYLNKSKCPYPPQSVIDLSTMLDEMGIQCAYQVGQLDAFKHRTLCVIAGRTRDNPKLFRECIGIGASHIYLESPGAPSIEQLRDMQSLAETRGVTVYMGYQRLCSSFVEKAVSLSRSIPKTHVFLSHNEPYRSDEVYLAVGRHPEGMIHSMAAQELAVLVVELDVKVNEIQAFKVNTNRLFSERQTFYNKATGAKLTDFSRVAFKITTNTRKSVSIMADRCGGLVSFAVVKSRSGKELQRFQSHDEGQTASVESELREDTELDHQCIIDGEEYLELKKRIVRSILQRRDPRKVHGLVSIKDGIEVMALADYCTAEINAVLKADSDD